jgi:hypothetical protein
LAEKEMNDMHKPWMPVVAGILDIVSGACGVAIGLFMALPFHAARAAQAAPGVAPRFGPHMGGGFPPMPNFFFPGMSLAMGITLIVLGALAIVGGVYSLRIKNWGLALAGSIGAVITGRLLGIVALIFIVLGRKDFQNT